MKLVEVFNKSESFDQQLLKALHDYVSDNYHHPKGRYGKHVFEFLLKHPKASLFTYVGPLKKRIPIKREFDSNLISKRGGVASWSKGHYDEDYYKKDPDPNSPYKTLLLQQFGKGIDIQKVVKYLEDQKYDINDETKYYADEEDEVIAPYYSNLKILNP